MTDILIVEDDVQLQALLVSLLEPLQRKVHVALSVPEARERIVTNGPVLVLSDYHLATSETGLDLWQHCREMVPAIPFVLMSGVPDDVFQKLVTTGIPCPNFLAKPFSGKECRNMIQKILPAA